MRPFADWKNRSRKAEIERNVKYRLASGKLSRAEGDMEKLVASFRQKAEEAQRAENHDLAVHFAGEAERLSRHLASSTQMRRTADTVQVLSEGNRALKETLEITGEMVDGMDPEALAQARMAWEVNREQVEMLMAESDAAFGDIPETQDTQQRARGEAYLREIMKSRTEAEKKRSRLVQETNRKLDELLKNRTSAGQDETGG